jgi:hypothetical protein
MRDSTEVDQGNGGILAVAAAKDMEALSQCEVAPATPGGGVSCFPSCSTERILFAVHLPKSIPCWK